MIDILDEMAKKLNFTYVLHLAQASLSLNSTDEFNATVRERKKLQAQIKSISIFSR
jgi:hypothetical protein